MDEVDAAAVVIASVTSVAGVADTISFQLVSMWPMSLY